jgi:hypothetical protein
MSVMRHKVPMKGRRVIGFAPLTGHPSNSDGELILDWLYAPKDPLAEPPPAAPEDPDPAPKVVSRGVRAGSEQPSLL